MLDYRCGHVGRSPLRCQCNKSHVLLIVTTDKTRWYQMSSKTILFTLWSGKYILLETIKLILPDAQLPPGYFGNVNNEYLAVIRITYFRVSSSEKTENLVNLLIT